MRHVELDFEVREKALARFVSFLDGENLHAMTGIFADRFQQLEEVGINTLFGLQIGNAVGAQLDLWGVITGVRRDGLLDDEFRGLVSARIMSNYSETEIEVLLDIMSALVGVFNVTYVPVYPAGVGYFYIRETQTSDTARTRIRNWMLGVLGSGVSLDYVTEALDPALMLIDLGEDGIDMDDGLMADVY